MFELLNPCLDVFSCSSGGGYSWTLMEVYSRAAREPLITLTVMMMACWLVRRLLRCQKDDQSGGGVHPMISANGIQRDGGGGGVYIGQGAGLVDFDAILMWLVSLTPFNSSGAGSIDPHLIHDAAKKCQVEHQGEENAAIGGRPWEKVFDDFLSKGMGYGTMGISYIFA